ncbi:MAG: DUF2141 domain-containing protein [Sphingomonas sp.]|nr:DUF2141 domain-containing protein [Sphingomonas sp.]
MPRLSLLLAAALVATPTMPAAAAAYPVGTDASACESGNGPAIEAIIMGLKDRKGRLKLELYPANEKDFLRDDRDLINEGKFFRRVWADTPADGQVSVCIKAPKPGRYALFFTHDRDGKNKFNFWADGAGLPSNSKMGMSRPKLAMAEINVGAGVTTTTIRAQYLRGLNGFGPIKQGR